MDSQFFVTIETDLAAYLMSRDYIINETATPFGTDHVFFVFTDKPERKADVISFYQGGPPTDSEEYTECFQMLADVKKFIQRNVRAHQPDVAAPPRHDLIYRVDSWPPEDRDTGGTN